MPRYKLTIEYDGTGFVGWQRQENGMSVQQAIEEAIAAFAGEAPGIRGAGRTDAGVHATGQVAHVDLARDWDAEKVREATNAHLRPHAVAILSAERVADDFDARFSAVKRHYLYRIIDRRAPLALERHHAWHVRHRLDEGAMHAAAQGFLGKHDFTTFRASQCQAKSPVKTLDAFSVSREGDVISLTCSARSFLHNQVRSMVGTLKLVGEGKWTASDLKDALDAADRTRCGPVCPPDGLYLTRVDY
ncbi:tRNA pseudouridine(38-40) synthase TruA [Breoghania sp. JC706]|uniref:tRNA pseudouridine(38-40) synthase TruA n=1 Tax=Breoghania sp. JC706 TaxID=3117732 RepID=UPI0030091C11